MIIDSHCHLDYEPINSSLDQVIKRAKLNGVMNLLHAGEFHKCQKHFYIYLLYQLFLKNFYLELKL